MQHAMRIGLVLITSMLLGNVAMAHTSYPKEITCPIDGKKFTIYVTGSYTTFGSKRDFQKQGAIGDFYESLVSSCPKCHYSGYQDDFDTTFTKQTKEEISQLLEPYRHVKMNDVVENEIAVQIHQYFKRPFDDIAGLYLIASYYLRGDTARTAKRKELQQNSAKFLIQALAANEYAKESEHASVQYLVGELYRRTSQFDLAIQYYDLALGNADKPKWLEEIATEQRELALKKDENNLI